jgi:hypothetical protein
LSGTTASEAAAQLAGRAPLPWERHGFKHSALARRLLRLREPVVRCLARDPAQRPSAAQVAESWTDLFEAERASPVAACT